MLPCSEASSLTRDARLCSCTEIVPCLADLCLEGKMHYELLLSASGKVLASFLDVHGTHGPVGFMSESKLVWNGPMMKEDGDKGV